MRSLVALKPSPCLSPRALIPLLLAAFLPFSLAAQATAQPPASADPVVALVGRLDLEKYKATIKGLTQFGDRRQGTDRNRAAVDWIEAQLKSYGCPTERIKYVYDPPPPNPGGGRGRGNHAIPRGRRRPAARRPHADRRQHRSDEAARREAARAEHRSRRRRARARRSTAPRSARRIPTRCTSSARTWTATAGARRPTTTARAPRW